MIIQSVNINSTVKLSHGDLSFDIIFLSTPKNFIISKNKNNYLLAIKKNIQSALFVSAEDKVNFIFEKDVSYSRLISFKIVYDILYSSSQSSIEFGIQDKNFILDVSNGSFEIDDEGNVLLFLNDYTTVINLYEKSEDVFKSLAIIADSTVIDNTTYNPEFSIACFDDSTFTIPRHVRFGNPVISTVPANITSSSTDTDIQYYNIGKGPIYKTIYFRIICNKIIETLSSNALSELKLKVYLPNGLDTVKTAQYVSMYFVSSSSSTNTSIYKAQYDFYQQGQNNNADYVDGLMYFDVQVPLTVQNYMPIQFDFSL